MTLKEIFYDWGGANLAIFQFIQEYKLPALNPVLRAYAHYVNDDHFLYYLVAIVMIGVLSLLARYARGREVESRHVMTWVGVTLVLVCSYACVLLVVGVLKDYFAFPRPYLLPQGAGYLIGERLLQTSDYRSMPSLHTAFIAMLIVSLWPKMLGFGRLVGVVLILAMAYTRMAMGVHFPADVLYGTLIAVIITCTVRRLIYKPLNIHYY